MTPAARVQAAIEVLDSILDGQAAEKALTNWARRSRFAGSGDRAAIRDHVYQALRCRRSYAARGGALSGRGLMLGALREAGLDPKTIFSGDGYAPTTLSDTEQQAPAKGPTSDDFWDLPDWLIEAFHGSLGVQAAPTATALRNRAPVMLRVNLRKGDVSAAIVALAKDGVTAEPVEIATAALIVTDGARRVASSFAYREGLVELQDGSSQAAMECIPVPEGGKVLDYCAGGGGKTLALAARAEARWFAHDGLSHRMKDLPERAARAGIKAQLVETGDVSRRGPYDLVLCDVPCSGSGTWRRAPEAKWALTPEALDDLTVLQGCILDQAALLVADGGCLAYATCSVLAQEDHDQIDRFLTQNPSWICEFTRSWPVSAQGDGFFLSIMRCRKGAVTQS